MNFSKILSLIVVGTLSISLNSLAQYNMPDEGAILREMSDIRSSGGFRMELNGRGGIYYLEPVPGTDRFQTVSEGDLRERAVNSIKRRENPPVVVKKTIPEVTFNTRTAIYELSEYRNSLRTLDASRVDELVSDDLVKGKKRDKILQKRMLIEREINRAILELDELRLAGNNNVDDANRVLEKLGNKEWFKATTKASVARLQKNQGWSLAESKRFYSHWVGFNVLTKTVLLAPAFGVYAAYGNEAKNSKQNSTKYDSGDAMEPNFKAANK